MQNTAIFQECHTPGYGSRIFYTADLLNLAKAKFGGMWGNDKIWDVMNKSDRSKFEIFGFEYQNKDKIIGDESSVDDVISALKEMGINIILFRDLRGLGYEVLG